MRNIQREQNPDVNSIPTHAENRGVEQQTPDGNDNADIERPRDEDIPLQPDERHAVAIEEPPDANKGPTGDVDDSPKRIAGE